ncbi:MAG: glycogen debranching enzyme GlgX, partial [Planctomycetota bacterium]
RNPWREWNDQYRDVVRRFWRGDRGQVGDFVARVSGSSDLFHLNRRGPSSSINFVTCHDGFTLADLVSYDHKHNEANGENDRDGTDRNFSRNWGVEGQTDQANVMNIRDRVQRSVLATLAFSLGVPMLSMGDETGRTQRGNNNTYCQNNETAWVNWELNPGRRCLLLWVRRLFAIRRSIDELRRDQHFAGRVLPESKLKDVTWLNEHGCEMTAGDWHDGERSFFGMLINTRKRQPEPACMAADRDETPDPRLTKCCLMLFNGSDRNVEFNMPGMGTWTRLIDTATTKIQPKTITTPTMDLLAHTVQVFGFVESE